MTPPDTIPIEGNARVEGKAGGLTVSWASFGPVTDAHFAAAEAPQRVLLADDGQMRTTVETIRAENGGRPGRWPGLPTPFATRGEAPGRCPT